MKEEKGITLIILVVTVVVILIITGATLVNINTGKEYKDYKKMTADIEVLKDKVLIYYRNYGEIPKKGTEINSTSTSIHKTKGTLYEIDLTKLQNISLNYGTSGEENDIYIINDTTLDIYYLKGMEYRGSIVYK